MAPSFKVNSLKDLDEAINEWGGHFPVVLKTRREAYDGKGNYVITSEKDKIVAIKTLCNLSNEQIPEETLYVEKFIEFSSELAVMVTKTKKSVSKEDSNLYFCFPLVETIHSKNILRIVIAPARVSDKINLQAQTLAISAIRSFGDEAGIFGVEMFLNHDGTVLINEIAPRPHNSGHFSIEACNVSQFEQHLRAILGWPLCTIQMSKPSTMLNIIGIGESNSNLIKQILNEAFVLPTASIHWYGKSSQTENRKLGHITFSGYSIDDLIEKMLLLPNIDTITSFSTKKRLLAHFEKLKSINKLHSKPIVSIIMGSDSDLSKMTPAAEVLNKFNLEFEVEIISAHRTPNRMFEYAKLAHERGIKVIIAAAGGAAHLPGMVASLTPLPVIGVPIKIEPLLGLDSLLSIVQMPQGIPVATVAINNSANAALLSIRILSLSMPELTIKIQDYQKKLQDTVIEKADNLHEIGYEKYLQNFE